ncbi:MAG: hypothetical protein K8R50_11485 [Betaproteobacteria bacterium]|nr:hypothetical protein [Betaproteobacteria bacterium]
MCLTVLIARTPKVMMKTVARLMVEALKQGFSGPISHKNWSPVMMGACNARAKLSSYVYFGKDETVSDA